MFPINNIPLNFEGRVRFFSKQEQSSALSTFSEKVLDEILEYLTRSLDNLAKEAMNNFEYQDDIQSLENFLSGQFDIRLEKMLQAKNSSVYHLESGMKNRAIQRKQRLLEEITGKFRG